VGPGETLGCQAARSLDPVELLDAASTVSTASAIAQARNGWAGRGWSDRQDVALGAAPRVVPAPVAAGEASRPDHTIGSWS
jgi:hypothetical protein